MSNPLKIPFIYLIGNIINRIGAFIMLPVYTNYLSIKEYGMLELIYSMTALFSVFLGAGLAHTTLRFFFENKTHRYQSSVINTSLLLSMVFSLLGFLILTYFQREISTLVFDDVNFHQIIVTVSLIMIFELLNEVYFAYIRAMEKAVFFVVLTIIKLILQISLTIFLLVYSGAKIDGILNANLISVFAAFLLLSFYTHYRCGFIFSKLLINPMLRYSIPFAISSIIGVVLFNTDKFLLKYFFGLESVGIYGLAKNFSLILTFLVVEPYMKTFGPYRFKIMNSPNARKSYSSITYFVYSISVFLFLGISLFTPDILYFASPREYWISSKLVPILAFGIIFQALNYSFQTGILIQKKTKNLIWVTLATAIINVSMNILLIPKYNYYGAAVSFTISYLAMAIMTNLISQSYLKVSYPYKKMSAVVLLTVPYLIYLYVIPYSYSIQNILLKLLFCTLFIITYLLIDKEAMKKILSSNFNNSNNTIN